MTLFLCECLCHKLPLVRIQVGARPLDLVGNRQELETEEFMLQAHVYDNPKIRFKSIFIAEKLHPAQKAKCLFYLLDVKIQGWRYRQVVLYLW